MNRAPLRIVVLFHPDSSSARELGLDLYRRFATTSSPGLRTPVAFAQVREDHMPMDALRLEDAVHTLVVVLIDARMARRAREADRQVAVAWADLTVGLIERLAGTSGPHGILPVAADAGGLRLDERLAQLSFARLDHLSDRTDRSSELCFQVAGAALRLLTDRGLTPGSTSKAPITLFVSHAKPDLYARKDPKLEGPVGELMAHLAQNPVDGWFDAKNIEKGSRFDEALRQAIERCDVMVCVVTDKWSEREWCRREALMAKASGTPVVIVDALESEIPRLFPYIGNVCAFRWQKGRPQTVILAALMEALRYRHATLVLAGRKRPGDYVLGIQPEALTLLRLPADTKRVMYPDPPLPREELEALTPGHLIDDKTARLVAPARLAFDHLQPLELTTPLTEIARWHRPPHLETVALSLSGATDIDAWGASSEHLATLADELAMMLLFAGLRLCFSGALDYVGARNDEINYTERLFGLVRTYSPMAKTLGASRFHPVIHAVAWPLYKCYKDQDLEKYGQEAVLQDGPTPQLNVAAAALAMDPGGYFPRETMLQKWAYARGMTALREQLGHTVSARVALAGKLSGYQGPLPGVLEEILIARLGPRPIPLYLIGAFGGATRYAIDLLQWRDQEHCPRVEATTAWVTEHQPDYALLCDEYRHHGDVVPSPEELAQSLRSLGRQGPAKALANGLTDDENLELFYSTDSYRMVELILTGLRRRFDTPAL